MGCFDGGIPPPKHPKHSFAGLRMPLRVYAIALDIGGFEINLWHNSVVINLCY